MNKVYKLHYAQDTWKYNIGRTSSCSLFWSRNLDTVTRFGVDTQILCSTHITVRSSRDTPHVVWTAHGVLLIVGRGFIAAVITCWWNKNKHFRISCFTNLPGNWFIWIYLLSLCVSYLISVESIVCYLQLWWYILFQPN